MLKLLKIPKSLHHSINKLTFATVGKIANEMGGWQEEKEKMLKMPLEEKRKFYSAKSYTTLNEVPTWKKYAESTSLAKPIPRLIGQDIDVSLNSVLVEKVSIFKGDITCLEVYKE